MGRRWIGIEMGEHAATHCLPRLEKVVAGEQGGISAAVGWQGGGGFRFLRLGEPVFDAAGRIQPQVRFASLAAFVWQQATRRAYTSPVPGARAGTPLVGTHDGTAIYLLYNGILGDRRPEGGNVLTLAVLQALKAIVPHAGPKVVYAEACRLGAARLAAEGIAFRQIPYEISGQ
jgi:adenine-specific DNA-methyltransferase